MRHLRIVPRLVPVLLLLALAGCGKFFVPVNGGSSGGSAGGTGTGNYFYVANDSATAAVAGFAIGTSSISNTSNSPYSLGVAPSAMAVTPSGSYLYVATLAGAIYGFSVGSNGALSMLNNSSALVSGISPVALRVDPTGGWLVALEPGSSVTASLAYVFAINSSSGLLTQQGNALALDAGSPNSIVFTPSNGLVYISLGTGGVDVCTLNVSTGALTKTNQILKPLGSANADQGLAVDPGGKYLFVAETGANGLRVLSIASTGALTEVSGSPFKTGLGPTAVLVDSTGGYVYVTNRTDGTVSAFSLASTGALTAITGSPFATGAQPSDLAEDTAHTHIGVACAGGSPDFQVFTIGSATSAAPGGLTSFAKTTGTNASGAFAVVAAD